MLSRRSLLALAAVPPLLRAAGRGTLAVPAISKYNDLATDLPVTRLTDPAFTSVLAANAVSRRNNFLLFASDESGRSEVYRMDLKKSEARQVSEAEALIPNTPTLLPNDNGFLYGDGDRLLSASFNNPRTTQIARLSDGYSCAGLTVSSDGLYHVIVEKRDAAHRLRLVNARTGSATLAEADEGMGDPQVRPKRASVLYRRGGGLYLANFDGKQNYRLRLPEGDVRQAKWSPDGRTVLYLQGNKIREFTPDTNMDKEVADTTQFASFDRNGDGTVFTGAGGSKVSPYVFLLVRAVNRELTLCEHRSSDPAAVRPVFSPNSQQVFFNSDLHGKPAIYRVDVEKLVEATA